MLEEAAKDHRLLVTIEEGVLTGGFGEQVLCQVQKRRLPLHVLNIGLPDEYIEHGNVEVLRKETGLDPDTITKQILTTYLCLETE